ncbi:MAG: hypothetical protein QXU43_02860 [Thermoproteota archaeon]
MEALKKRVLRLLEKDEEFRYTVAGYLGLSEVLRRIDGMTGEQAKMREEMLKLGEEQVKLREEMLKLSQEQAKMREEMLKLGEEQVKLREEMLKLSQEQAKMREEMLKLGEEQAKMRSDFNEMLKEIRTIDIRLTRVERTLEKLTLDIEEEARSIIKHRVKTEFGFEVIIESLALPGLELNIYGVTEDVCILGEASVRAGSSLLDELLEKIDILKRNYPDKLRGKIIPVIYTSLPMPDLVEKASERKIWILKATGNITNPSIWQPA